MTHPDQPVQEQWIPQAELSAHGHERPPTWRYRDLMSRALPHLQQGLRVTKELLAGRRQRCARLVANEELAAEQRLERSHARTHCRLREMQALRCAQEVAGRNDFQEGSRQIEIHAVRSLDETFRSIVLHGTRNKLRFT